MTEGKSRIPSPGSRIAVVGSGIAGLASAWLLSRRYSVTLFEAGSYFGGHSNTVDVTVDGITHPVDTGFLVHNDLTYPNLIALFEHLGVPVHQSDMSFGVSIEEPDIEWAGSNLGTVFAQKSLMFNPRFIVMLSQILKFNRNANQYLLECSNQPDITLGELLKRHGYGRAMQYWYLLPMAAAIWSSSVRDILSFPAATFLRFCLNHRLLQIEGRPQWRTVLGGSRVYVQAMLKSIQDARLDCPVLEISRRHLINAESGQQSAGIVVRTARSTEVFDAVVMACHAPTSLGLIDATDQECDILGAVRYQPNEAVLHTDPALLPRRKKVWSAWNYLSTPSRDDAHAVAVSYLINCLQPLPFTTPVIVTLNSHRPIDESRVIRRFNYEHPVMDLPAIRAQQRLGVIQGQLGTWFCGAWCGYGFHEDGLKSAIAVARDFGIEPPWAGVVA
ncbi:NAD(P)/FAD-dependent oxidoreductase [Orrella marina]|uniref:NAD/FAD-binding protein n=1 Tax=Orrella marina TaxID=2163011 RepID=A0A2R4XGE0_9BURK|nr:FAD-dependent oxidoreductase [Orrella marina]AWB32867.1 NAD/FAD-binding protein [Orrella marina]